MKKTSLHLLIAFSLPLFIISGAASASNYVMRQPVNGIKYSNSPSDGEGSPGSEWISVEPLYGSWVSSSDPSDSECSDWTPLESSVDKNTQFLQSQSCTEEQTRNVTNREFNSSLNEYRVVSITTENQTISIDQTRLATGTKLVLQCAPFQTLVNYVNRTRGGAGVHSWVLNGVTIAQSADTSVVVNGTTYYQGNEIVTKQHEICWENQ